MWTNELRTDLPLWGQKQAQGQSHLLQGQSLHWPDWGGSWWWNTCAVCTGLYLGVSCMHWWSWSQTVQRARVFLSGKPKIRKVKIIILIAILSNLSNHTIKCKSIKCHQDNTSGIWRALWLAVTTLESRWICSCKSLWKKTQLSTRQQKLLKKMRLIMYQSKVITVCLNTSISQ